MPILKKKDAHGGVVTKRKDASRSHFRGFVEARGHVDAIKYNFKYKDFCRTYLVTPETISRLTGTALRTVAYWKAGKEPQRSSRQKLRELCRLFDALSEIIQPKSIGPWLTRSNPAFEGSTPLQVIERGEADRVWKMIWELREGHSG
jgi:hypothetical protein